MLNEQHNKVARQGYVQKALYANKQISQGKFLGISYNFMIPNLIQSFQSWNKKQTLEAGSMRLQKKIQSRGQEDVNVVSTYT